MQVPSFAGGTQPGWQLFTLINEYLEENGLKVSTGTIVDATIIDAPTSTKNKDGKRDPEMHQTKKGNEWYFGMKGHIGVDSQTKLAFGGSHGGERTRQPVTGGLLHGDETRVWGDSAYSGQGDVIAEHAPRAKDFTNKKGARNRPLSAEDKSKNRTKSKVRAKGEHPFLILKRIFGFNKVRYRGLDECQPAVCCLHGAQTIIATNIGQVRLEFTVDQKNRA